MSFLQNENKTIYLITLMKPASRTQRPAQLKKRSRWVDCAWFLAFLVVCALAYRTACTKDQELLRTLVTTHRQLKSLKDEALFLRGELVAQIESQKDAEWVELLLKEKLGVVPRGQSKIFFEITENP